MWGRESLTLFSFQSAARDFSAHYLDMNMALCQ